MRERDWFVVGVKLLGVFWGTHAVYQLLVFVEYRFGFTVSTSVDP